MANFVTNIVHFQGDPERIEDLRGAVQDDQYGMSGFDFQKIIPMPSGLWMGGINPDTRAKYGKNNWLEWSIANWGTKWNAFRFDDDDQYSDGKITFVTANNAPAPIMQKLSEMYPDITMRHQWADDNVAITVESGSTRLVRLSRNSNLNPVSGLWTMPAKSWVPHRQTTA